MRIVVYTGAGISYDSGVPLFEDKDSVFSKYPLEIVAYKDGWKKNWQLFKSFMDKDLGFAQSISGALPFVIRVLINPALMILTLNGYPYKELESPSQKVVSADFDDP